MTQGQGTFSCGKYLAENGQDRVVANVWVAGYITGFNRWNAYGIADVMSKTDFDGGVAWIKNYCNSHPTDDLATAAEALIFFLNKKN